MSEETIPKEKKAKKGRVGMPEQEPQVRARNFLEVPTGYTPEMAKEEAARCLQCGLICYNRTAQSESLDMEEATA